MNSIGPLPSLRCPSLRCPHLHRLGAWLFGSVLLAATHAGGAAAFSIPDGVPPGNRAVVIGVDQYLDPELNLPPDSSTTDARNVARMAERALGFSSDQILPLLNRDASKANIMRAIDEWLIEGSTPGSKILLSYSGHGAQWQDDDGDEADGLDEVLIPWDTKVTSQGVQNLIIDDEIHARLSRLTDRDVLLIIDSCHSGDVSRSTSLLIPDAEEPVVRLAKPIVAANRRLHGNAPDVRSADATLGPRAEDESFVAREGNTRVLTAVSSTELALVDATASPKQGVFTRRLYQAIMDGRADANRNGIISNAEVLNYVRQTSTAYCQNSPGCKRKNYTLTPTLESNPDRLGRDFRTGESADGTPDVIVDTLGAGDAGSGGMGTASGGTGPLRLRILPGDSVPVGTKVVFEVTSPVTGYLVLLDVNAEGSVTQIFPNEFSDGVGGAVTAGRTMHFPEPHYEFAFEAEPPIGRGMLVAVATSRAVNLAEVAPASRGFAVVERPAVMVGEIAQRIAEALQHHFSGQNVQWAYATRAYTIQP